VVGGHDHERLVVQLLGLQPLDNLADQPVGVGQLQQVALLA
jgi:hypothetical protein